MNPYAITGPACISFSGGRTSGYMLRKILDAHGGTLPGDVRVCFANTGKEYEETLVFIRECSVRWNVPITWVEYRPVPVRFVIVTFESASRNGEPFDAIIEEMGYLPGPALRFCSQELKQRAIKWCLDASGWKHWTNIVGMRADEPSRIAKVRANGHDRGDSLCPLADAHVSESDVMAFWRASPFDLHLASYQGNCDLCFLKSPSKRVRIMREAPERSAWWIDHEHKATLAHAQSDRFRPHTDDYQALATFAMRQGVLPFYDDAALDLGDCACTD